MEKLKLLIIIFVLFTIANFAQININFGDSVYSFNAGILTPTPDRALMGIEYVDGYFWISGWDPDDFYNKKLYKISEDGTELIEYYARGNAFDLSWGELTYDGEYLYGTNINSISQIDPETGQGTGINIPSPYYYNNGIAYDALTDNFWLTGDGSKIYKIDRQGYILTAISEPENFETVSLVYDSLTANGPYLWIWGYEIVGFDKEMKALQLHIPTQEYTGKEINGVETFEPPIDLPRAATILPDFAGTNGPVFVALQLSHLDYPDGLDWVVFYNLADSSGFTGSQISVNPESINNILMEGETLDVEVTILNNGDAPLNYTTRIEPENGTPPNGILGDSLLSFVATELTPTLDNGLTGIAFNDSTFYVTGYNFNGEEGPKLYRFNREGNELIGVYNQPTAQTFGLKDITSDGEYLYGISQYSITQFYIDTTLHIVNNFINTGFSGTSIAYDPQKEHFYLGSETGAIVEKNKDGDEINFIITPYIIKGLAWDNYSDSGPYLWAWVSDTSSSSVSTIKAIRLDPQTGFSTGIEFDGINLSSNPDDPDKPVSAIITKDWQNGKIIFSGLQASNSSNINDGFDRVVVYDLAETPQPEWIQLLNPSFGSIEAGQSGILTVRLMALMSDTTMTTAVKISSNDITQPELFIPVIAEMQSSPTNYKNENIIPEEFSLEQNYPNPFNPSTKISYSIPKTSRVELKVYNILGKEVDILVNKTQQPGRYEVTFNGSNLSSGIYFYRLQADKFVQTKKLILLK